MKTSSLGMQDCEVLHCRNVEERDTITRVPLLFCICFPKRIAQRMGWLVNLFPHQVHNLPSRG